MKHLRFTTICITLALTIAIKNIQANENNSTSWFKKLKFTFDDGNIMENIESAHEQTPQIDDQQPEQIEAIENTTLKIQKKEKGTHQLSRRIIIKPLINVANYTTNAVSGVAARIGKALHFVTHSTGLDTNTSFFSGPVDSFKHHIHMIYPGTRWCGDGDKARFEDDLGTFEDTDKCCRAHDKCFMFIPAGETKFGLHNTGLFTRSHCDCDSDFYACLKNSTDLIARKIGFTYFSVLGPQCFKEEDYITGCIHYSRGKCIEYRSDPTKGKMYQWFDSPLFI